MLGVTQKTAWFMLHRIRLAMSDKRFGHSKIGNSDGGSGVEVDETFVGGRLKNMHKDKKVRYEIRAGSHRQGRGHGTARPRSPASPR